MKYTKYFLLIVLAGFLAVSCWEEDVPEAGESRHQVVDLKAVPGDEEVQLSWSMPDGWNPDDFIVYYTDTESETITMYTGGTMSCTIDNLVNDYQYTFYVQAVYDALISNYATVVATPATERFAVTDLLADAGDQYVILTWTKPGTSVLYYTLTWYAENDVDNINTVTLDADVETYALTDIENDLNYYFTLVAVYEKGSSEAATARAMPAYAIPYKIDRETAAVNQPVTFSFNTEEYPTATDVKWTFPDESVLGGNEVQYSFTSAGTQSIKLSATISGITKTWTIEMEIREYVVWYSDWMQDGTTYNGLKGACPVFSPDGSTVYIITFSKITGLYAFDLLTGDLKWRYIPDTNAGSYNPLTVNPVTGDIYYGTTTAGLFYAVTAEGELKWMFTGTQSMQSCAPAVSADGSVVFICDKSGNTFAVDAASGTQIWSFAAGTAGTGLLVNGEELVVGATSAIYFLNVNDGTQIAKVTPAKSMTDISGFAVNADKTIAYVPNTGGYISSINLQTHAMVVDGFLAVSNNVYEPVVAPDGTVFFGSKDGSVCNVNADLTTVNWTYDTGISNAFNYSHPCVDADNRFYITSGGSSNVNFIFSSSGTVVDSWTYEPDDAQQKQMGGNNFLDGVLYSGFIGSSSANGLFVGKYVGGERASGWSTHGGDICGSCCVK